jgi:hypothetical protein
MVKEKHVYTCFKGKIRSRELADEANATGEINARHFPGVKKRLLELDISAVQAAIAEDELVVLVTEPRSFWQEDHELSERAISLLQQANRRWRSDTFLDLLNELVAKRLK